MFCVRLFDTKRILFSNTSGRNSICENPYAALLTDPIFEVSLLLEQSAHMHTASVWIRNTNIQSNTLCVCVDLAVEGVDILTHAHANTHQRNTGQIRNDLC